jgi:hypothetical protein
MQSLTQKPKVKVHKQSKKIIDYYKSVESDFKIFLFCDQWSLVVRRVGKQRGEFSVQKRKVQRED